MGATRPFREAGEMWCDQDSTLRRAGGLPERNERDATDDQAITLETGDTAEVRIPYDGIVRANLIDEGLTT